MNNKQMTQEQAYRKLAKVAISFRALENGSISLMSERDFQKFMEWLK